MKKNLSNARGNMTERERERVTLSDKKQEGSLEE